MLEQFLQLNIIKSHEVRSIQPFQIIDQTKFSFQGQQRSKRHQGKRTHDKSKLSYKDKCVREKDEVYSSTACSQLTESKLNRNCGLSSKHSQSPRDLISKGLRRDMLNTQSDSSLRLNHKPATPARYTQQSFNKRQTPCQNLSPVNFEKEYVCRKSLAFYNQNNGSPGKLGLFKRLSCDRLVSLSPLRRKEMKQTEGNQKENKSTNSNQIKVVRHGQESPGFKVKRKGLFSREIQKSKEKSFDKAIRQSRMKKRSTEFFKGKNNPLVVQRDDVPLKQKKKDSLNDEYYFKANTKAHRQSSGWNSQHCDRFSFGQNKAIRCQPFKSHQQKVEESQQIQPIASEKNKAQEVDWNAEITILNLNPTTNEKRKLNEQSNLSNQETSIFSVNNSDLNEVKEESSSSRVLTMDPFEY